mmetsp:Transcript_9906/g.25266  ORF Transcript_9906/g.25266 Transcript_9906/m.25266 type:complete len:87 (-) Transcript_9906:68-328(-)
MQRRYKPQHLCASPSLGETCTSSLYHKLDRDTLVTIMAAQGGHPFAAWQLILGQAMPRQDQGLGSDGAEHQHRSARSASGKRPEAL